MTTGPSAGYQIFMLTLCLFALGALAARVLIRLDPNTREVLDYADYAVCGLFFLDFVVCLVRAPNRWAYFRTWGWLDLLSSVPTLDFARWGRAARIVRLLRVLRGLRATRLIATVVLQRRAESTFLAAGLLALLLIVFCSLAVLNFEAVEGANIKTAEDAVWWAFATITTVGYGDRFPITPEGRLIGVILMCAGVGLFGTFSGFLAAWFLQPEGSTRESEIALLRQELSSLRQALIAREYPGA